MSYACRGFPAKRARSYAEIERNAMNVRKVLFPDHCLQCALPGVRCFESLHLCSIRLSGQQIWLDFAVEELPNGVEAKTSFEDGRIVVVLDESTYRNLARENKRARFSLMHEIGHAVLHSEEVLHLASFTPQQAALLRGSLTEYPVYLDTEWQADAFAAALLMPAHGLKELQDEHGELDADLIEETFNVSKQAAETRLQKFLEKGDQMLNGRKPWL